MLKMRRPFYRIARIIAMFFIGLVVAVVIALSQVNLETLRGELVSVLRDATGMDVEIGGALSWKLSLRPRVVLNKVSIASAGRTGEKAGFSAEKIDVTLNLLSLLRTRPTIQSVRIYDAVLNLEKNENGDYSLAMSRESPAPNAGGVRKYPFEDFGLGSVEVRGATLHIDGSTYSLAGLAVSYSPGKDSREYNGWVKIDAKLYPFIISFSEYNEERKVYPLRFAISTGGDALVANVALEGKSLIPIDFIIKGDIPDIAPIAKMLAIELPELPRISVNLAGGFGKKKLTIHKSTVSARTSDLTVSGGIDWSGDVTAVTAKLKSTKIDLYEVFPGLYSPDTPWVRPDRDLNVFKDTPLYGSEMLKYNLNLDADVESLIVYRDMKIQNINLHARLQDAVMRAEVKAKYADGDVNAAADISADRDGTLRAVAAGIGERVYIGELLKEIREDDFISELPMNFEFYLQGSGADLSGLMSTVTGPVYVYSVAPGYAHSDLVSYVYGTDFLTDLRHNIQDLFRSQKKHNQITIDCAAVNIKLRDGVVETANGVAMESNAVNVRLAGSVDLGRETMKASLITVPSRGLKISLTGSLTNSMTFTGNLAEPDVKISGAAMMGKVAAGTGIGLLLAPVTGGLSLVAGAGIGLVAGDFLENWLADPHPCKTAMDSGAPKMSGDPEWLGMPMATLVNEVIRD